MAPEPPWLPSKADVSTLNRETVGCSCCEPLTGRPWAKPQLLWVLASWSVERSIGPNEPALLSLRQAHSWLVRETPEGCAAGKLRPRPWQGCRVGGTTSGQHRVVGAFSSSSSVNSSSELEFSLRNVFKKIFFWLDFYSLSQTHHSVW